MDRNQAVHYAQGKASTVFEMEMGMVLVLFLSTFFPTNPTDRPHLI